MTFLTIREAADRTGHSTHKIRRLIKSIADHPENPDRPLIEPTPADVDRLTAERVQFTWRVSEELVRQRLGDTPPLTRAAGERGSGEGESADTLALLHRAMAAKEQAEARLFEQLRTKDEQLAGLQATVTSLNERLRESNLLMANIQKQLPPPKAEPIGNAGGEKKPSASHAKPTASATHQKKPLRKSWLGKFFG